MGWPIKGSGKSYNSNTGFGSFRGGYTKKVLSSKIFVGDTGCVRMQRESIPRQTNTIASKTIPPVDHQKVCSP